MAAVRAEHGGKRLDMISQVREDKRRAALPEAGDCVMHDLPVPEGVSREILDHLKVGLPFISERPERGNLNFSKKYTLANFPAPQKGHKH